MSFLKLALGFSALAFATQSLAAGPSTGGGGDVVRLPDDSVVLADPFLDHSGQQPNNMPPLRSLNPRLLQAANSYLMAIEDLLTPNKETGKNDIKEEIKKLTVRKSGLRFYGVRDEAELNTFCAPGGRKSYKLPNGAQVQQAACTAGLETFLVEPLFAKLSLRQQVLLLIHERLTTLRDQYGGKNYSAIARFTTGMNTYLDILKEQSEKKYRKLTPQEVEILTQFYIAMEEINLRNADAPHDAFQTRVHPLGGGRILEDSEVDESAFIDLASRIGNSVRIGARAQIKGSTVRESTIENDTQIISSVVDSSSIGEFSIVDKSHVNLIKSGKNLTLTSVEIFPVVAYYEMNAKMVYVADNQSLKSQKISYATYLYYAPEGYVYKIGNQYSFKVRHSSTWDGQNASEADLKKGTRTFTKVIENTIEWTTSYDRDVRRTLFSNPQVTDSNFRYSLRMLPPQKTDQMTIDPEGKFVRVGLRKVIPAECDVFGFAKDKIKEIGIEIDRNCRLHLDVVKSK